MLVAPPAGFPTLSPSLCARASLPALQANRDWDSLIDDFVALGFLPAGCDRGLIIPVMERVLGPYLRGGGAKAFNFQALSTDLLVGGSGVAASGRPSPPPAA